MSTHKIVNSFWKLFSKSFRKSKEVEEEAVGMDLNNLFSIDFYFDRENIILRHPKQIHWRKKINDVRLPSNEQ